MDGTLVDTEPYWMAAETTLVESYGGTWTHEDGLTLVGSAMVQSAAVLQARGVRLSAIEISAWLTGRVLERLHSGLTWRPGAEELLRGVRAEGIRTALVTSSPRMLADAVVAAIGFEAFDAVVCGEDVIRNKPFPDPYLLAAERLGVTASDCIAIEDSTPGLASAVQAGVTTIGVPMHSQLFPDQGYLIWPTLSGTSVSQLVDAHCSARGTYSKGLV